jgi:GTP-binding protein
LFFDEARIHVAGGDGGNGVISFRREKHVAMGGPDGGNGGDGGSVYLVASEHYNTLSMFKKQSHFEAEDGANGEGQRRTGKSGDNLIIEVPTGTVVYDDATDQPIADLVKDGQKVLVAQGGQGGRGNACFATSTNQAPRVATKGDPGERHWLRLELKLIADVGIIGMPNAGKSTLLSVITAAKPKIAGYPFTTLVPNLGVVDLGERVFVVADVPGLIEGAHEGAGLGHQFLRHVERTKVLIHLLDGASQDPLADMEKINEELELFQPRLAEKPQLVVLNKMDLPQAQELWPQVQEALKSRDVPVMSISAVTGEGIQPLLWQTVQLLDSVPEEEQGEPEETKVFRPRPVDAPEFHILPDEDGFRVVGPKIERIAARTVWESFEAVTRFQNILKALGIYEALEEAGIDTGDTLYIGDVEFDWI